MTPSPNAAVGTGKAADLTRRILAGECLEPWLLVVVTEEETFTIGSRVSPDMVLGCVRSLIERALAEGTLQVDGVNIIAGGSGPMFGGVPSGPVQ